MPFGFWLIVIVLMSAAIFVGQRWYCYRTTPHYLAKRRLAEAIARHRETQVRLEAERVQMQLIVEGLRSAALQSYFTTVDVAGLEMFPKIGPSTIEKLKSGNFHNLSQLRNRTFEHLDGIGPVKAQEIRDAVGMLERESIVAFDSESSPAGRKFREQSANRRAVESLEEDRRSRTLVAIHTTLQTLTHQQLEADRYTFFDFLRGKLAPAIAEPTEQLLPPEPVTNLPMPVVEQRLAPSVEPLPIVSPEKMQEIADFVVSVARVDGNFAQSERLVIEAFLLGRFGADTAIRAKLPELVQTAERNAISQRDAIAILRKREPNERAYLYAIAELIADAAGERNARESAQLLRFAAELLPSEKVIPVTPEPKPGSSDLRHNPTLDALFGD